MATKEWAGLVDYEQARQVQSISNVTNPLNLIPHRTPRHRDLSSSIVTWGWLGLSWACSAEARRAEGIRAAPQAQEIEAIHD